MINLNFTKDYILENDFVRLSPLELRHIRHLQTIADEDSIWTYFLENGKGINKLKKYIRSAINNRKENREYPFVVFDKRTKEYAGMTRLYDWNEYLKIIKLGHTWYGKKFQGTNVNKQCKYLLFEFIFEQLEAVRIGFGVHAENTRSLYALKSVGCQREGVLRDFLFKVNSQERTDLILLSILQKEWFENIKSNLSLKLKN